MEKTKNDFTFNEKLLALEKYGDDTLSLFQNYVTRALKISFDTTEYKQFKKKIDFKENWQFALRVKKIVEDNQRSTRMYEVLGRLISAIKALGHYEENTALITTVVQLGRFQLEFANHNEK